jgi:hypothetical protein
MNAAHAGGHAGAELEQLEADGCDDRSIEAARAASGRWVQPSNALMAAIHFGGDPIHSVELAVSKHTNLVFAVAPITPRLIILL